MKITGADSNLNQAKVDELRNKERQAPAKSGNSQKSVAKGTSTETVAVSGMAKEIGKVRASVKEVPDVRKEKVEAIKAKIEAGEYHVSADQIAGKIIKDIIKQGK